MERMQASRMEKVQISDKMKGNLYILMAALIWSTGGLLIKFVPWNGIVINGFRAIFAYLLFAMVRHSFKIKINRNIICGALGLAAVTTLFALANKMTTAANAIVLQYMSPIFVLIMESIRTKKLPSKKQIAIVVITFSGMVLFFLDQLSAGYMLGNILAILSGFAFACVFFFNSQPDGSSDDANMLGFLIAIIVSIPFMFIYKPVFTTTSILATVILGFFQVGLAYVVFGRGIKRTDAVSGSLISMLEAVANPVWVFLFMHEKPGPFALLGSTVILCAVTANIILSKDE